MTSDRQPSDADLVEALTDRLAQFEVHTAGHLLRWIHAADLTFAELRVFLTLVDGEPHSGGELAEVAGLDVEMAYPALHKLEARGWLAEDERMHSLGEAGRDQLGELTAIRRATVGDFVASLPTGERRSLAAALCGQSAPAPESTPG